MKTTLVVNCLTCCLVLSACLAGCKSGGGNEPAPSEDTYDVDASGVPKIAGVNFIDLSKIHRISRFRSSVGHDYWDDFEHCRSLKHYFEPKGTVDWATVAITSPVKGTVFRLTQEWAGTQVQIRSDDHPAFFFIIFHIALSTALSPGDKVAAGQQLGMHIGSQTMSDIAVGVSTPKGWKLVSWFDVMTDVVFQEYQSRGVTARADAVITKEQREADPLSCSGDTFLTTGTTENWIVLN